MKLGALVVAVTLVTTYLFDRHTDRYSLKIVKSRSEHPKKCKSDKTASLNVLRKKYFHLTYFSRRN